MLPVDFFLPQLTLKKKKSWGVRDSIWSMHACWIPPPHCPQAAYSKHTSCLLRLQEFSACRGSDAGSDCNLATLRCSSTVAMDVKGLFCILSQKYVPWMDLSLIKSHV